MTDPRPQLTAVLAARLAPAAEALALAYANGIDFGLMGRLRPISSPRPSPSRGTGTLQTGQRRTGPEGDGGDRNDAEWPPSNGTAAVSPRLGENAWI